jgi:uncharacterized membrane protein YtjA (UPF0391 family)
MNTSINSTISKILGGKTTSSYSVSSSTAGFSQGVSGFGSDSASGILKSLFYIVLIILVIFLFLLLIHYTYKPIFKFFPGAKGFIPIAANSDDMVYWADKKQPATLKDSESPKADDTLAAYDFINNFSFSVDLYVGKFVDTNPNNRLVLFKTSKLDFTAPSLSVNTAPNTNLQEFMKDKSSMIMYFDDANNLIVTFYVGTNKTPFSCRPIQNIPLYEPFRVSVVVDNKLFTVYLNGKQTFQKLVPGEITGSVNQRFYIGPDWARQVKTVYVQNLHVWPRAISYDEVKNASPALARKEDFDILPEDNTGGSCY